MKKLIMLCLAMILLQNTAVFAETSDVRYLSQSQINMTVDKNELDIQSLFDKFPQTVKIRQQADHYQVLGQYSDELDAMHYVIAPVIDGTTVRDYIILVHTDEEGVVTSVNGELDREPINLTNSQVISNDLAIEFALTHLKLTPELNAYQTDAKYTAYDEYKIDVERMKRVYVIQVQIHKDEENYEVIVDAENGDILNSRKTSAEKTIKRFSAKGIGTTGEEYSLVATEVKDKAYLFGKVGDTRLTTFVMNVDTLGYQIASDDDGNFDDETQRAIVQTHHNMETVLKYFQDEFGWASYDGLGTPVQVVTNYTEDGEDLDNAMWDGNRFVFGAGDPKLSYHNGIALDIVAHEFMHGVTGSTASLVYENQSGALDESISDMFGYFVSPDNYLIGEDLLREGGDESLVLRSLEDPTKYGQPAHINDYVESENNLDGDFGGVHINNGIPNHAGYLLVKAIGRNSASYIYFYAIQNYFFPYAEFTDARIALQLAAERLYGSDSDEAKAVAAAWDAVGVTE